MSAASMTESAPRPSRIRSSSAAWSSLNATASSVTPSTASSVTSPVPASSVPSSEVEVSSANDDRLRDPARPTLGGVLVLDALLQQHDALDERLGPRRTARHVDVDRDDLIDALGDRVAVPVGPAAVRARSHRDDVLPVGHLLVEPLDRGRHLVGDGAGDHDEVGLARARRERDHAEAHDVVARTGQGDAHLDRAARQAPLQHPQRVLAAVGEQLADRLEGTLAQCAARHQAHVSSPLRQRYASPATRISTNTAISMKPNQPRPLLSAFTAHGKTNTVSTSKITNSRA